MKELIEKLESISNTLRKDFAMYGAYEVIQEAIQALTSVKSEQICPICNGDGFNIEAQCCGKGEEQCCGIPIPVQVQCENCQATGYIPSVKSESAEDKSNDDIMMLSFKHTNPISEERTINWNDGYILGYRDAMHDFANNSEAMKEDFKYFFECGRNYQNNAEITFNVAYTEYLTNKEK